MEKIGHIIALLFLSGLISLLLTILLLLVIGLVAVLIEILGRQSIIVLVLVALLWGFVFNYLNDNY